MTILKKFGPRAGFAMAELNCGENFDFEKKYFTVGEDTLNKNPAISPPKPHNFNSHIHAALINKTRIHN
jgi:hypothetical protein